MGANPALIGAGTGGDDHRDAAVAARGTLEAFLGFALAGAPDAAILLEDGTWVTPLGRSGNAILVAGQEDGVRAVGVGEVQDWGFTGTDGRLHGNWRARASLADLAGDAAAGMAAALADTPLPAVPEEPRDFLLAGARGSL